MIRSSFDARGLCVSYFLSSTSQCVMSLELRIQLLCGGDDTSHGVDDETVFCHTTVGHMAIGACSVKQHTTEVNGCEAEEHRKLSEMFHIEQNKLHKCIFSHA